MNLKATSALSFRSELWLVAGLIALVVVVLSFSGGSTLVKASHTPGITVAFWRMVLCSGIWAVILRISEGRWLTLGDIRAAFVPGMLFGTNIAFFFTGVTRTSIATAEFTGALSPMLVIPLGALIFKERVHLRALSFGAISVVGLALVLFGGHVIQSFSLAMMFGMVIGAYSSIFICSPMLIYLGLRNEEGDRLAAKPEASAHDAPATTQALLETVAQKLPAIRTAEAAADEAVRQGAKRPAFLK